MKKFMLIMRGNSELFTQLSQEKQDAAIKEHKEWGGKLAAEKRLLDGAGFSNNTVRLTKSGNSVNIKNNYYANSGEALSGFYLILAKNIDDAIITAHECPGLTQGDSIEVVPLGH